MSDEEQTSAARLFDLTLRARLLQVKKHVIIYCLMVLFFVLRMSFNIDQIVNIPEENHSQKKKNIF